MGNVIRIEKGPNGWGGPLTVQLTEKRNKVVCITGGSLHPVAVRIAQLLNAELVNGFKTGVPDDEIAVAIVDCGGTLRCGIYPKKGVPTVNVTPVGKSGPMAKFIVETIYVSDVKENTITLLEGDAAVDVPVAAAAAPAASEPRVDEAPAGKGNILARFGKAAGGVINIFFQAGRDTIDMVIKTILPFMAFVSMIVGIILQTGLGDFIAAAISPYAGSLGGLLVISIICGLPVLSPLLGPGAVIAQVIGVLLGTQIAAGAIPPSFALPALFAIDTQVGCDFMPVGLSLMDAEAETVEIGVPAILISRAIAGPCAVIVAYFVGMGLFA
jgi:Phosphotransferase system sorbitol-specific component IIBC